MRGFEKLKEQFIKDKEGNKSMIPIVKYLLTRMDMDKYLLNESKNLEELKKFIENKAKSEAIDGVAVIEDRVIYNWTIEYYQKTNEELGLEKLHVRHVEDCQMELKLE